MSKLAFAIIIVLLCALGVALYFATLPYWHKDPSPQTTASTGEEKAEPAQAVCTGMVEATGGEIDVCAQLSGELLEVRVLEGEKVQKGQVLAVVDARRQNAEIAVAAASVGLAQAKLKRVQAGVGEEEKQEALLAVEAVAALLKYETANCDRLRKLYATKAISLDELERSEDQVDHLRKQMDGLKKHYESLRRGPLPEEIALARAEVAEAEERLRQAKVNYEYRMVYAPIAGTILQVYRHAGDAVSVQQQTPILRMVDAGRLRIRLEIDEAYAPQLEPGAPGTPGREGTFQVGGISDSVGRLVVTTLIPQFGPKRLFNPDTSARIDTRILAVLCEIKECRIPLHPGQRITARIPLKDDRHKGPAPSETPPRKPESSVRAGYPTSGFRLCYNNNWD
jgi:HlyD family secretion protein